MQAIGGGRQQDVQSSVSVSGRTGRRARPVRSGCIPRPSGGGSKPSRSGPRRSTCAPPGRAGDTMCMCVAVAVRTSGRAGRWAFWRPRGSSCRNRRMPRLGCGRGSRSGSTLCRRSHARSAARSRRTGHTASSALAGSSCRTPADRPSDASADASVRIARSARARRRPGNRRREPAPAPATLGAIRPRRRQRIRRPADVVGERPRSRSAEMQSADRGDHPLSRPRDIRQPLHQKRDHVPECLVEVAVDVHPRVTNRPVGGSWSGGPLAWRANRFLSCGPVRSQREPRSNPRRRRRGCRRARRVCPSTDAAAAA